MGDLEERIAQIMARWQASTPGEWITTADSPGSAYDGEIVAVRYSADDPTDARLDRVLTVPELDDRPDDLIFAAHAHQDIPALVEALTAARRELAIATQALIKIEEFSVAHQRIATNIYYQTTKALNLLHISGAAAE